jgi:large subunit ribosomal protein L22
MGARKRHSVEIKKEKKKTTYSAKLYNNPTSPRKARLVANLVRGLEVNRALNILQHSPQEAAGKMYKLLLSAISNWQSKNEGARIEDSNLFIKDLTVDGGRMLKRIKTAPQGRAARIKKRSNHISLTIENRNLTENAIEETQEIEETVETPEAPKAKAEKVTKAKTTKKVSNKKSNIKE